MRGDTEAVGGFFEDLPVLAFVLAGVLSVAGTACWTSERLSDEALPEALAYAADALVESVVFELTDTATTPSIDAVRGANLSGPFTGLAQGTDALVSIWCLHPTLEPVLAVSTALGEPEVACSGRALMNAVCAGGVVGVLEVRVLVWVANA